MGNYLNFKKLFVIEIGIVLVIVIVVAVFVEVTPYLAASNSNGQIGVFNQKTYAQETATLKSGERASSRFNYTTFDPAILVVDLNFKDWQKPGYLSLYCNGILLVTFDATPNNPYVELTSVTFSGYDIVKSPPTKATGSFIFAYGNEVSLLSPQENGFEGTFDYQISIRGSR
jgi:hypothetical protein